MINLLNEQQASEFLGVGSPKTLQRWRVIGYGPPFLKVGHGVRYFQSDLTEWLEGQRRRSTSDVKVANAQ